MDKKTILETETNEPITEMSMVDGCPALGTQIIDICLPVDIKPSVKVGRVKTKCLGPAEVSRGTKPCEKMDCGECGFTIRQKICVEVPVEFKIETKPGEIRHNCEKVSNESL